MLMYGQLFASEGSTEKIALSMIPASVAKLLLTIAAAMDGSWSAGA